MGSQDLDVKRVAVGVLHILTRRALVEFPGSTRSHPAPYAVVSLTFSRALFPHWSHYFPFKVPWDLWQNQVVPVLTEIRAEGTLASFLRGSYEQRLARIEAMLMGDLTGSLDTEALEESTEADGTTEVDPELFWPDGTPKKVYPSVE